MRHQLLSTLALAAGLVSSVTRAEEGGGGHYMPGATASFIDTLPGRETWAVASLSTYYDASAHADKPMRFGGFTSVDVNAIAFVETVAVLYQTPVHLLGGSYAVGLAVPFGTLEVKGAVKPPVGPIVNRSDTASGVGDIILMPFMLGWTNGPDFKYDARLNIYAPSGEYNAGQVANMGRNYWTFEPAVSASWLSTTIGTEVTVFAGLDFNTKNHATDYQTGTQFHLDGTVAQHLPLLGGIFGAGANGFYYTQLSGDSGTGATLGSFEGHTAGVGPVLSYVHKVGKSDLAAELKWLPELTTRNRLRGDIIWFKLGVVF